MDQAEFEKLMRNLDIIGKKVEELNPISCDEIQCKTAYVMIDSLGVILEQKHAHFKKHVPKELPNQWRGKVDEEEM